MKAQHLRHACEQMLQPLRVDRHDEDGEVDGPCLLLAGGKEKTWVSARTLSGVVALPRFSRPSSAIHSLVVRVGGGPHRPCDS